MILQLHQLECKVRQYTSIIHAPEEYIPTFGYSKNSGLPHIEFKNEAYYFIVLENKKELSKKMTSDPDELLFLIMNNISLSMASDRVFKDSKIKSLKKRLFQAQENILSKIHLSFIDNIKNRQDELQGEYEIIH